MSREKEYRVLQEHPEPFDLEGGSVGMLLLHGFTGTPREMRRLGDYLNARGCTVSAPLLPGHGTTLAEMNRYGWRDWVAGVESAYTTLQARCEQVFVGGLSLGALLALWLGAQHPEARGLLVYSPVLWVADRRAYLMILLRFVVRSLSITTTADLQDPAAAAWVGGLERAPVPAVDQLLRLQRRVRRLLPRVQVPALVVYARGDQAIHPRCGPETVRRLGSADVETLVLEHSGHNLVVDREWERVAEVSYRFISRYRA
ncbi:MAG: alpha/beta fold hydrolase [Anaerolineae bacterium]|nr:alpha/beta fold hydrolase [Anaerolineae bacterium]